MVFNNLYITKICTIKKNKQTKKQQQQQKALINNVFICIKAITVKFIDTSDTLFDKIES